MKAFTPTVFAVGQSYQIMAKAPQPSLFWVQVGDRCYYDHVNGILRSDTDIHRVTVPAEALNREKQYTVCEQKIIERKPYFSQVGAVEKTVYPFHPVEAGPVRAYHIADAHNMVAQPIAAAQAFGEFDLLILNGDVPDHSGQTKNFDHIYEICSALTHGSLPVIFSRGNHDMRGVCAEKLAEYTPVSNGKSYYTVRLGSLWALVLDCGEDKEDSCEEYGGTVCCHAFRQEETEFLLDVIRRAEEEYAAEGVTVRLVIVHSPFTEKFRGKFDIENEIYDRWCQLLRDEIKPDFMLCGHVHRLQVRKAGCPEDARGQACTVILGSESDYKSYFAGAGYCFSPEGTQLTFTDSKGKILHTEQLS